MSERLVSGRALDAQAVRVSLAPLLATGCAAVGGLGLSRVLFELFFPRAVWLGRPPAAIGLAALAAVAGWWFWRVLAQRQGQWAALAPFLPLLLNLQAVLQPQGPTRLSRLLFAGSIWLAIAVGVLLLGRRRRLAASLLLLSGALLPVYLLTMGQTVGRADTFEFQVVIPKLGIVHPTGYPLYLLLGKLFTFIPFGSVAWRINLASVVFATIAAALVFLFVWQLTRRPLPALLAALLLALSPTFWSQAIEAEVYALHAVVVGGVMVVVGRLEIGDWRLGPRRLGWGDWRLEIGDWRLTPRRMLVLVYLLVGLGLANHLTTVILLPGVLLATVFALVRRRQRETLRSEDSAQDDSSRFQSQTLRSEGSTQVHRTQSPVSNLQSLISNLFLALTLPLLLYLYLPLRWAAVNGEPMGLARFLDWVIGGRFQGALRLDAFVTDPSRYAVVGRLLLAEWRPAWLLLLAGIGFGWLVWRNWRLALIVGLTFLGTVFYALSYYVPDLAVFLLPAQLVLAMCWGLGLGVVMRRAEIGRLEIGRLGIRDWRLGDWRLGDWGLGWALGALVSGLLALGVVGLVLNGAVDTWEQVDRSRADGGTTWAAVVLELPLARGAAILADSERFPPLYYLQQAEGVRPDLDIMVLPDEAAYRAELGARLTAGQTVYLARFLPGLEGQYHLRSAGPLVEVGREPLTRLPVEATESDLRFDGVRLLGYELEEAVDTGAGARARPLTLYWQATAAAAQAQPLYVYTRWQGAGYEGAPVPAGGQHPANNSYPTLAWEPGEVVPDYHLLPLPVLGEAQRLALQVALAPPFSAAADLQWQTVTTMPVSPPATLPQAQQVYAQVGGALLHAVQVQRQIRPQEALPVFLQGCGNGGDLQLALRDAVVARGGVDQRANVAPCDAPFVLRETVDAEREMGAYGLWALAPGAPGSRCHWLAAPSSGCELTTVAISGVALPEGATNFGDKIALMALDVTEATLQPGGSVRLEATWQALAPVEENYTLFAQVVDAQDRIVGQIDTWPVQGTFPTSQWQPGEVVRDAYTIQLQSDVPPGEYRLLLGWYLLATQQRLPVLDESGTVVEDRVVAPLGS